MRLYKIAAPISSWIKGLPNYDPKSIPTAKPFFGFNINDANSGSAYRLTGDWILRKGSDYGNRLSVKRTGGLIASPWLASKFGQAYFDPNRDQEFLKQLNITGAVPKKPTKPQEPAKSKQKGFFDTAGQYWGKGLDWMKANPGKTLAYGLGAAGILALVMMMLRNNDD